MEPDDPSAPWLPLEDPAPPMRPPRAPMSPPGKALLWGLLAVALVLLLAVAIWTQLDLDRDGLTTQQEWQHGTFATSGDSDGDGLTDGDEVNVVHSNPLRADSDGDGLTDGAEVRIDHTAPLRADSDADGLSDSAELSGTSNGRYGNGSTDPNNSDTDGDGLTDGFEAGGFTGPNHTVAYSDPNVADTDHDNVTDGAEGNPLCILAPDCDGDGLADGVERGDPFQALDPDTFGVHLPDAITYAFQKAGQPASRDQDADGIPDAWESAAGLVDWGTFQPRPGQRDLLVEFVRVLGPDSGRFESIQLAGAYENVKAAFAAHQITMQYTETVVRFPEEPIPALLPTRSSSFYSSVLNQSQYAANPYVLTVVLDPQLDQTEILHAGIAPIRGMLAAVDLSQFVTFTFQSTKGDTVRAAPFIESLMRAGRLDQTVNPNGIHPDGSYYLLASGREFRWNPYWFTNPRLSGGPNGTFLTLKITSKTLAEAPLAHAIMHEMGHTLGLCHTHLADCRSLLPISQQSHEAESTMSYDSDQSVLNFLDGEWDRVATYLTCPPPGPLKLLAEGGSIDAILNSKYAYNLDTLDSLSVRACENFTPVPRTLVPQANTTLYVADTAWANPHNVSDGETSTAGYAAGAFVAAVLVGLATRMRLLATARNGRP